jgi:hypothetical protein
MRDWQSKLDDIPEGVRQTLCWLSDPETFDAPDPEAVEAALSEARAEGAREERERAGRLRRDVGYAVAQYRNLIRLHTTGEPYLLRIVEERLSGNHDAADEIFDWLNSEEDPTND